MVYGIILLLLLLTMFKLKKIKN